MTARLKTGLRHGGLALPWRTLMLGAAAVLAYLFCGAAPEVFVYDRAAISQGELWRLVTGHWVHSDPVHAFWDIAALLSLGILFEHRLQWRLPAALLFAMAGIDVWLWWGEPALLYYCGLSGILNSLLVLGLLQLWHELRHPLVLVTGAVAAMKIIAEIDAGQTLLTRTAWPGVPAVHAVGFLCGLVLGWWFCGDSLGRSCGRMSCRGFR